jgi:hypothetical protein
MILRLYNITPESKQSHYELIRETEQKHFGRTTAAIDKDHGKIW